jgi:hypothetical protein
MQSDTKSFIVRIWVESETDEDDASKWRGVVEQVGSSNRLYFQDLARAFRFVQEQAGITDKTNSGPPRLQSIFEWIRYAIYLRRDEQDDSTEESDRD